MTLVAAGSGMAPLAAPGVSGPMPRTGRIAVATLGMLSAAASAVLGILGVLPSLRSLG